MNLLKTLLHWASSAFGFVAGLPADIGHALSAVWHYVTSVHNLLSWVTGNPVLKFARNVLVNISVFHAAIVAIRIALHRLAVWLLVHYIRPIAAALNARITRLQLWTSGRLTALRLFAIQLYVNAIAYTDQQVGAERAQRVRADQAEHAAMLAQVKAALALVQQEAASGYNSELHARLGVAGLLLDEIATRNPAARALVTALVNGLFELESVDNPLLRLTLGRILAQIINHFVIDKVTGQLAQTLLGPLLGQPRAANLHDAERDIAGRLNVLEGQWAAFMAAGGPEVEQAGREWKDITSLSVDAGLLAILGLAVADPPAWAAAVANSIGTVGNDALGGIVSLIRKA